MPIRQAQGKKRNSIFIILGILFCLNLLAWMAVWELGWRGDLGVTFFDVGQGDAILIVSSITRYRV